MSTRADPSHSRRAWTCEREYRRRTARLTAHGRRHPFTDTQPVREHASTLRGAAWMAGAA